MEVGTDIRLIFISKDRAEAEMRLRDMVKEYHKIAPRLADWMEKAIPEGLTFFSLRTIVVFAQATSWSA